jgi:WD40 repeat protein
MVHSLAWSASGRLLAAGLGDGNIPIFSMENRTLVQTGYLPEGHDSSVAHVCFPNFCGGSERILLSGGSDGAILCWDIGPNVLDSKDPVVPSQIFPESLLSQRRDRDDSMMMDEQPMDELQGLSRRTQELSLDQPKILFGIPHGRKVNWMTTSKQSVFVADTSNDITAYTIPLQ